MSILDRLRDAALDCGLGRRYGHEGADTTNCIRFTFACLQLMYPDVDWTSHRKVMVLDSEPLGSFANVTTLCALGLARWVDVPPMGGASYCQGWRQGGRSGHSFWLVHFPSPSVRGLWLLEATNVRDDWYRPVLWGDVISEFPDLYIAALVK